MPDTPIEQQRGDPYHPDLGVRVSRLEDDVHDMKATMSRLEVMVAEIKATLEATLPHLATKAELADMRSELKVEIALLRNELADKPSKTYMWGVLTALLAAYACGLAALAVLK
jgi:hypothetical protein